MKTRNEIFESESCGRCGGSGSHSYCQAYADNCFGCGGSGKKLTKRGSVALRFYNEMFNCKVSDLVIGDSFSNNGKSHKVESIVTSDDGGFVVDCKYLTLRTGSQSSVRKCSSTEVIAERRLEAEAYQNKLTKAGKLMKKYADQA